MVKPGVFTVDKQQVNLKKGEATVEYVHIEVKHVQKKSKGCTLKRLVGVFLILAVLTGIAVGVTYAVKWEEEDFEPHMPEGGDVIYPENPADQDGHHGNGDTDWRRGTTERPPPIDYIGTRPPQNPTRPIRPRTGLPQHPTQPTRPRTVFPRHPTSATQPTRPPPPHEQTRPPRTRPPHHRTRPPRTRPPHEPTRPPHHHPHRPPHHPPHHHPHHPPHDEPYYPSDMPPHDYVPNTMPPLFGRPDGHDYPHTGYEVSDEADDEPRDHNREDVDHPNMKHRNSYKGISAWKADRAIEHRRIVEERMRELTRKRPQHAGRSRVEMEEERHGYDYGHSD